MLKYAPVPSSGAPAMSGPVRPTLYKPEHAGRARELCARVATNPDLAGQLERILWVRQQNDRRKGRKGRKPRILRKWGLFRRWREAAETGGNWRKLAETACRNSARETVRIFPVSLWGPLQSPDWRIACGNCGNPSCRSKAIVCDPC